MDTSIKTEINGQDPKYETRMATHIITGETAPPKMGRPFKNGTPQKTEPLRKKVLATYSEIEIDGISYMKGIIISKGSPVEFLFDIDDFERVKERTWFVSTAGKYISCNLYVNNQRKTLALHNFVMKRFDFPGKGAKESVDHINRDGLDNRKCNLRLVSQAIQNTNQKKRERTARLPEGISELPKHIWYVKANGAHGDRFCIELKTEGIKWKTTSSKKVSIQDKLKQALEKRDELYTLYPYLLQSSLV